MAALCSRCGHYIFALWFLLSIFFFPHLISAVADWMSIPYFHTWCGLSANLGRRSETCCRRLTVNTGRKRSPKNRHLSTIAQLCLAVSSQLRHLSTIGNNVLNSNIFSTCPHNMVNFSPLTAEICWRVWGTPTNFILTALLHGTLVVGVSQTLRR